MALRSSQTHVQVPESGPSGIPGRLALGWRARVLTYGFYRRELGATPLVAAGMAVFGSYLGGSSR